MSYCKYCKDLPEDNLHKIYHDNHYGVMIYDDKEFFERLVLEINQAGLSWDLILKKQAGFKQAFYDYDIKAISEMQEGEKLTLLENKEIIRNRLKIQAVIHNAGVFLEIIAEHGSFKKWLDGHHPMPKENWVKLFKKTFKFTGGEIVNEFLMSTSYLPGAHEEGCYRYGG